MAEIDEQLVFEMGYNKGFKDGIKGSIPKAEIIKFVEECKKEISDKVISIVREDYIHKADYETRLKADMVAMLIEIDNKIMEEYIEHMEVDWHNIIQQKINALKENKDDN